MMYINYIIIARHTSALFAYKNHTNNHNKWATTAVFAQHTMKRQSINFYKM